MAVQRYLGDDLPGSMRNHANTIHHSPPEYPLEHRFPSAEAHSMHELSNGIRTCSIKHDDALSLSEEKLFPTEGSNGNTNASTSSHARSSFSGITNKKIVPKAMENYITPRTGECLHIHS